jgi:hypothetical protein
VSNERTILELMGGLLQILKPVTVTQKANINKYTHSFVKKIIELFTMSDNVINVLKKIRIDQ